MAEMRVYIVRGSEDGNIGVFSSAKKAYDRGCKYFTDNGWEDFVAPDVAKVKAELKTSGYSQIDYGNSYAEIEVFYLND